MKSQTMRSAAIAAVLFGSFTSGVCWGGTFSNPAPSAQDLIAKSNSEIFIEQTPSNIRHKQSGLLCPLVFPNVNLWHLEIFSADGTDIGCDYGRNGNDNLWVTKLTIFAVRAPDGITADEAFSHYKAEFLHTYPKAISKGEAILSESGRPVGMETVRSEEFTVKHDGIDAVDDVAVALKAGWIIEVRLTATTQAKNPVDAQKASQDLSLTAVALMQALSTVGESEM